MDKVTRQIDVLLFKGLNILDVAGPVQTFTSATECDPGRYRIRFVSVDGKPVVSSCGLQLGVDAVASATPDMGDLLIPGGPGVDRALVDDQISQLIATWPQRGDDCRIVSICSGALLVAKTGLLDAMPATTHWSRAHQVQRLFPKVHWDTNRLYFSEGPIMTSAGVTSGIDLALAIVRQDCGPRVALSVARELVVYLQRNGGQNQFADLLEAQFSTEKDLGRLLDAMFDRPEADWTLDRMADFAGLTPRTLSRRFMAHLSQTPTKFLERIRVQRASDLISENATIGQALAAAGFSDFQQMQRAFKRQLGATVGGYKQRFSKPQ